MIQQTCVRVSYANVFDSNSLLTATLDLLSYKFLNNAFCYKL